MSVVSQGSINALRVSICIKQSDAIEEILCKKLMRFMMMRAENFHILRRKPVEVTPFAPPPPAPSAVAASRREHPAPPPPANPKLPVVRPPGLRCPSSDPRGSA